MKSTLHAQADALFAELAGRSVPGMAVGLMQGGELLLAKGYGLASLAQRNPIRADTLFRIASVSKQFTVAAALLLEQRGLLSQDDDVRRHVPELGELPAVVRIGHLMRNTSGLPDLLELMRLGGANLDQRVDRAQLLQVMARNRHLNFTPGSRFLYCNSGFALLGVIVERLSGQSLGDFLQTEFFGPLGMGSTSLLVESDIALPGLASPYLSDGQGGWRRAQHGFEHGGEGGLVSTVPDLLLWAAHLLQPAPGVPDVAAALMATQVLANGSASPYALGLEHSQLDALDCVGHGGLWPGYRTEFLLLPAANLAVVVISNDGGSNPYQVARQLARLRLDLPTPQAPVPAAMLGQWLHAESGQLLGLSQQGTRLMASQWGVGFEMAPAGDGRWLPLRGAYELQILGLSEAGLEVDIGAGRRVTLKALPSERPPLPAGLEGLFVNADSGAHWRIEAGDQGLRLWAEGPVLRAQQAWTLRCLGDDLVELRSQGYWMQSSQLLRLERDGRGEIQALRMDSARVKGLRFLRQS
jgi:D-aminopeptidase